MLLFGWHTMLYNDILLKLSHGPCVLSNSLVWLQSEANSHPSRNLTLLSGTSSFSSSSIIQVTYSLPPFHRLPIFPPPIMDIWPMVTTLANRLDLHMLSILDNEKQRDHLEQARNEKLRRRRKQKKFPLFDLPLELRIQVYKHAVSDTEHNLTHYDWRKGGRLLPALFHTRLQITQEIYRFCPITTVMDIAIPDRLGPHNARINRPIPFHYAYVAMVKDMHQFLTMEYHAHRTVSRMLAANNAAKRFSSFEGRRGLSMKMKLTSMKCKGQCVGLSGGDQACEVCLWFSRFNSWKHVNLVLRRGDMLFEFCWKERAFWRVLQLRLW